MNVYSSIKKYIIRVHLNFVLFTFCFFFRYEKDFMTSLSGENQADFIEAFNSMFRHLDDLLNIDNP